MRIIAPDILTAMSERSGCKGVQHQKLYRHEWKDLIANIFFVNLCGVSPAHNFSLVRIYVGVRQSG